VIREEENLQVEMQTFLVKGLGSFQKDLIPEVLGKIFLDIARDGRVMIQSLISSWEDTDLPMKSRNTKTPDQNVFKRAPYSEVLRAQIAADSFGRRITIVVLCPLDLNK